MTTRYSSDEDFAAAGFRFTDYFEEEVLRKRPYISKEWCIRVITLEDQRTIHNAFPDRGFTP